MLYLCGHPHCAVPSTEPFCWSYQRKRASFFLLYLHPFLNRESRLGTTNDFTTSFLHFSLFTIAPWDLATSRPVHSLMFLPTSSSVCLVFFPRSLCFARWFWPDLMNGSFSSLRLFTMVRRSSCEGFPRKLWNIDSAIRPHAFGRIWWADKQKVIHLLHALQPRRITLHLQV